MSTNKDFDYLSELLALAGVSRTHAEISQIAEVANYDYGQNPEEQEEFEIDSYSFKGKAGLPIRMTGNYADNPMISDISEGNERIAQDMNNLLEGVDISAPIKKWRAGMDLTMTNEDYATLGRAFALMLRESNDSTLSAFHMLFSQMETTDILREYEEYSGALRIDISEWVKKHGSEPYSRTRRQWAFNLLGECYMFNGYYDEAKEKLKDFARIRNVNEAKLIP